MLSSSVCDIFYACPWLFWVSYCACNNYRNVYCLCFIVLKLKNGKCRWSFGLSYDFLVKSHLYAITKTKQCFLLSCFIFINIIYNDNWHGQTNLFDETLYWILPAVADVVQSAALWEQVSSHRLLATSVYRYYQLHNTYDIRDGIFTCVHA